MHLLTIAAFGDWQVPFCLVHKSVAKGPFSLSSIAAHRVSQPGCRHDGIDRVSVIRPIRGHGCPKAEAQVGQA